MKQILFLLIVFKSFFVFGQKQVIEINAYTNSDTSYWFEMCSRLELEKIQISKNNWNVRLWTNSQAIDIWEDTTGKTFGKVTTWTTEYTVKDEAPTNRILYQSRLLETDKTKKLISLIDSTDIKNIPDGNFIENWIQGSDGITYKIETSNKKDYFFKTYWTPNAQGTLKEALAVQKFVDSCYEISESGKIWNDFTTRIPFEYYTMGERTVFTNKMSKNKRRKLKKEREIYRKQQLISN